VQLAHKPEDEEFCVCDLWAAEAYITALDAGEKVLLDLLDRGIKIHNWVFDLLKEKFPEEIEKCGFTYKGAKQFVHASNYGAEAGKLAQESGLPVRICEWFLMTYHGKFPGIRLRQNRVRDEVLRTRTITSLLGRKRIFIAPFGNDVLNQAYAWGNQSVIGELTNIALTRLYYQGRHFQPWLLPALNTHDGLAIRCLKGQREQVRARVKDAFHIPITKGTLSMLVPVEIGFGPNFNDISDKQVVRYT